MLRTITPILSILAALLLFVLFTKPQYAEIQSLRAEIGHYEKATNEYAEFQQKIKSLLARRDAVSLVERERLDKFVPTEIEVTRLLVDLEALAKEKGMLFGNIKTEEPKEAKPSAQQASVAGSAEGGEYAVPSTSSALVTADITFDVIGTYEQFKQLLVALESSLTVYEVTNIGLLASESEFQQFSVTVRSYALPKIK